MKKIYLRESSDWKLHKYEGDTKEFIGSICHRIIIGNNVTMGESCHIDYDVIIEDNVVVGDAVFIGSGVVIKQGSTIRYKAFLDNGSIIGGKSDIGNESVLCAGAIVDDDTILTVGFFVNGSKNQMCYVGNGKISINCQTNTIDWFKENYEQLGVDNNYTPEEIQEYYGYILMAEAFYNAQADA